MLFEDYCIKFKANYSPPPLKRLTEDLCNAKKGTLHEILVGHFLINGIEHGHPDNWRCNGPDKFPPIPGNRKSSEETHDIFRRELNPFLYDRQVWIARETARYFLTHISLHNIKQIYWTYGSDDVGALLDTKEGKHNVSDLVIKMDDETLLGISLKANFVGYRMNTISAIGHNRLDLIFDTKTYQFIQEYFSNIETFAKKYNIDMDNCDNSQKNTIIRNHVAFCSYEKEQKDITLKKVAKTIRTQYADINGVQIASLLKSIVTRESEMFPVLKLTTFRSPKTDVLGHELVDANKELDQIIEPHLNVLYIDKNNKSRRLTFKGINSIPICAIRIASRSQTLYTGFQATLEGFTKQSKMYTNPVS